MTIHVVLADDEVLARQKLRLLLREQTDCEVVGECATAAETVALVRATHPDVVFLDIRMPDMDGFDVVDALSAEPEFTMPRIVFTTAYDQYAVRAFDVHAVDYLLKPFAPQRLQTTLQRIRERGNGGAAVGGEKKGGRYTSRIVFKSKGRILFLPVSEIRWIAAEENYVRIFTENETHLLRETMARLEERFDPQLFLRVHRSAIVNLQHVREVRTESDGETAVILLNGQKVPMSRSYRSRMQRLLHR
ncbi:MAG TPA: LytTR family transcriptional regulator DNA-binding domain-containing protein [Acidobacteriaceae bacterium]|nr:LytTR family transcriptional regulator DNA-binding domain-containing protein [Acidobacteriaceae bacterium]